MALDFLKLLLQISCSYSDKKLYQVVDFFQLKYNLYSAANNFDNYGSLLIFYMRQVRPYTPGCRLWG